MLDGLFRTMVLYIELPSWRSVVKKKVFAIREPPSPWGKGILASLLISPSLLYGHRPPNPSIPPFTRRGNYPSLAKRGEGRFSKAYIFFSVDSSVR
jgi:hypothetical protein